MSVKTQKELDEIIKPLRPCKSRFDVFYCDIENFLESFASRYNMSVELSPEFQRGHVWTDEQKLRYIEAVLKGTVKTTTVKFNSPFWLDDIDADMPNNFVCIDGLQRLTAILEYTKGKIKPFGLSLEDMRQTAYDVRRSTFCVSIEVYTYKKYAELLQFYIDLNAGGTPHSKTEIDRVKKLKESLGENKKG